MKKIILTALIILSTKAFTQCTSTRSFQGYWVISPGVTKYVNNGLGVNMELGVALPASPLVMTLKGSCWVNSQKGYDSSKDRHYSIDIAQGFTGAKIYYSPDAYQGTSRKLMFGAGAGAYMEDGKRGIAALETSAAYLIHLRSAIDTDQGAYFRAEINLVATERFVKPGITLTMFVLM